MDNIENPSRRNFFTRKNAKDKKNTLAIRPPWSFDGSLFIQNCSRCHKCIDVCDENIIEKDELGFPTVNFSQNSCSFCAKCEQICEPNALHKISDDLLLAWSHKIKISSSCLAQNNVICRSCADGCDYGVISFPLVIGKVAIPHLQLDKCNGCGACISLCPNDSISVHVYDTK